MTTKRDYYEVLNVSKDAPKTEIKKAFPPGIIMRSEDLAFKPNILVYKSIPLCTKLASGLRNISKAQFTPS